MTRTLSIARTLVVAALLIAPAVAGAQDTARSSDVATPEAIITALYEVISGPAGQKRDWGRFRSLFIPEARLIVARARRDTLTSPKPLVMTPESYVTTAGASLEERGFFEIEVSHVTESFGNVMHRFSTYESRRSADEAKPFARGINSIQLYNDGRRWWVVTIYWDQERPGLVIPDKYLPRR